jgi:hypothetical protein
MYYQQKHCIISRSNVLSEEVMSLLSAELHHYYIIKESITMSLSFSSSSLYGHHNHRNIICMSIILSAVLYNQLLSYYQHNYIIIIITILQFSEQSFEDTEKHLTHLQKPNTQPLH